jgi:hypothetical protein
VRFYFSHFEGFDSVLTKAIDRGDTAKYIRVYFSFVIDKNGTPYDGHFERIASTEYAKADNPRTIKYFSEDKKYYEKLIKEMVSKMTFWKPALQNAVPVDCKIIDYIQFWVGINPPKLIQRINCASMRLCEQIFVPREMTRRRFVISLIKGCLVFFVPAGNYTNRYASRHQ